MTLVNRLLGLPDHKRQSLAIELSVSNDGQWIAQARYSGDRWQKQNGTWNKCYTSGSGSTPDEAIERLLSGVEAGDGVCYS
jgi:hypothetical protein